MTQTDTRSIRTIAKEYLDRLPPHKVRQALVSRHGLTQEVAQALFVQLLNERDGTYFVVRDGELLDSRYDGLDLAEAAADALGGYAVLVVPAQSKSASEAIRHIARSLPGPVDEVLLEKLVIRLWKEKHVAYPGLAAAGDRQRTIRLSLARLAEDPAAP